MYHGGLSSMLYCSDTAAQRRVRPVLCLSVVVATLLSTSTSSISLLFTRLHDNSIHSTNNQPTTCFDKLEFHDADADTDILARILADTSDARDFLKLFL